MKHELAYYEAQKIMIQCNCLAKELPHEFNLSKTLSYTFPSNKRPHKETALSIKLSQLATPFQQLL